MKRTLITTAFIVATVATMAACDGLQVPQKATWAEDVKPILAAKCVHCHGYPAIQGAPDSFRLDVYDDTITADGRVIYGAARMAAWIQTRTDHEALDGFGNKPYRIAAMPPAPASLSDAQRQILFDWGNQLNWVDDLPLRGMRTDNQPPTIELTQPLADSVDGDLVTVHYELRDPDGEAVAGELRVGNDAATGMRVGSLELGPGQVVWDTGQFPNGTYGLFGVVDDGNGSHELDLGSFKVERTDPNAAPMVSVIAPKRYTISGDAVQPLAIIIGIADPDDTAFTILIRAVTDGAFYRITDGTSGVIGNNALTWPTTDVPAGTWRLEVTVKDSHGATRTVTGPPFTVSHDTSTTETYATLKPLFDKCADECHTQSITAPSIGLNNYASVFDQRGLVYRRVVQLRNMPPESYRTYNDGPDDPSLTDEERDRIGKWILAGAPEN